MSNVLTTINADKAKHVAECKSRVSEGELYARLSDAEPVRGFLRAMNAKIAAGDNALIAEVKKASPSKGLIRADFSPKDIATAYEKGGAVCLSVLTDIPYFQGHDEYLKEARAAVSLPVLRKDFMIDPYQVLEARTIGADCILLIMASLSNNQAQELEAAAFEQGMDVLIEVHDADEMERALSYLSSKLLGINNRNLKTLEVDMKNGEVLVPMVPQGYTLVCESGIKTYADIKRMNNVGVHGFLVGESLMRQADIEAAVKSLLGA